MPVPPGRGTVRSMLPLSLFPLSAQVQVAAAGELLRHRHQTLATVAHLERGRVLLGVCEHGQMRHQLGVVEAPFWLDAASALLGQPCALDMVAQTQVHLRHMPVEVFRRNCGDLPDCAQALLRSMAAGYLQQSGLAVSRLAQDAQSRCAQWLLQNAEPDTSGAMSVTLHQRKRHIAAQLGIAPETFSRVMRHLREHGLVAGTGSVLQLPQPVALQSVAGGWAG